MGCKPHKAPAPPDAARDAEGDVSGGDAEGAVLLDDVVEDQTDEQRSDDRSAVTADALTATAGGDDIVEKTVLLQNGAYTAVLGAAFGQITLQPERNNKAATVVHPCILLILVIPLFMAQLTALLSLRTDTVFREDTKMFIKDEDVTGIQGETVHHLHAQDGLKFMMIIIVQVIYFDSIMFTLEKMFFLLNPVMWAELHLPSVEVSGDNLYAKARRVMYTHKVFLLPPAFIAMMARFFVTYLVAVDSVSIILTSPTVKDTIFNCLAIGFLLDLNGCYWKVLHTVLHFGPPDVTEVTIQYNRAVWEDGNNRKSALSAKGEECTICPRFVNVLSRILPCRDGWAGREFEHMLASITIFFLAMRQVFIIMFALDTNIAPMTRDVCSEWRFQESYGFNKWFVNLWTWIDIREFVVEIVETKLEAKNCEDGGTYYRAELSEMVVCALGSPLKFGGMAVLIIFLLSGPVREDLARCMSTWCSCITRGPQARSKIRDINLSERIAELERLVEKQGNIIKNKAD